MSESVEIPREYRVSHSEVDSWLLCKRKHYYGYVLGITRVKQSDALQHGTDGHDILDGMFKMLMADPTADAEAYVRGRLMSAMIDGSIEQDSINMLQRQFKAFFALYPFKGDEILGVEKEFVLKISDTLYYPFVVDLITRMQDGRVRVVDHKFQLNFVSQRHLDLLPQIPKYIGAIQMMGLPADTGAYSIFRKGYSKKGAEDHDVYKLQPFDPPPERIEITMREQITAAQEIQQRKSLPLLDQDILAVRTANSLVCDRCSFHSICASDLRGGKATPLLMRSEYKKKEERVFTVESADDSEEE